MRNENPAPAVEKAASLALGALSGAEKQPFSWTSVLAARSKGNRGVRSFGTDVSLGWMMKTECLVWLRITTRQRRSKITDWVWADNKERWRPRKTGRTMDFYTESPEEGLEREGRENDRPREISAALKLRNASCLARSSVRRSPLVCSLWLTVERVHSKKHEMQAVQESVSMHATGKICTPLPNICTPDLGVVVSNLS